LSPALFQLGSHPRTIAQHRNLAIDEELARLLVVTPLGASFTAARNLSTARITAGSVKLY